MSRNSRIAWFGSAGLLVVAGVASVVAIGGGTGQILAFVLIGIGLVLATSLVFLEVGLSEDRERARVAKPRQRSARPRLVPRPHLERSRGHRHRLR